jgi:hypothetical protein
VAETE